VSRNKTTDDEKEVDTRKADPERVENQGATGSSIEDLRVKGRNGNGSKKSQRLQIIEDLRHAPPRNVTAGQVADWLFYFNAEPRMGRGAAMLKGMKGQ
jgi:hypothetical protein